LPEKFFVQLLPTNFLPPRSRRPLFGVISKKGLHVFLCKLWATLFEVKQRRAPFLPGFSWLFAKIFSKSKHLVKFIVIHNLSFGGLDLCLGG